MATYEDAIEDGFLGPVVHVDTQALRLIPTATETILEGQTVDTIKIIRT